MFVLAARFFFFKPLPSVSEFTADESVGVWSRGVGIAEEVESASSSASIPKESLPFAATLRFFLKEGIGVAALYFAN